MINKNTSSTQLPSTSEKTFVVLVLLISTSAFLTGGVATDLNTEAGMPGMQVLWASIYLVTIVLFTKHITGTLDTLKREFWLLIVIGFALASTIWSDAPLLTARKSLALACTTLFGVYFATRYSQKGQLRLLAVTFTVAALASVLFQFLGLSTATDVGVPGWIGVYGQKNVFGSNMALGSTILLIVSKSDPRYGGWARIGCALTVGLLFLSRSVTAALVFAAVLIMIPVCSGLRKSYRAIFLAGAICLPALFCGIGWAVFNLDAATELVGRDANLTGRLPLWVLSAQMALQRPWFGYGFCAFWRGEEGASAAIWRVLVWGPPHSHNGFLELWLGLGLFGLALFMIGFLERVKRAALLLRKSPGFASVWPALFLVMLFVSNLTQANLLSPNSIIWIIYVAISVHTGLVVTKPVTLSPHRRRLRRLTRRQCHPKGTNA